jgi:hypothetical protein
VRGQHRGQAHGAVADHRDGFALRHACGDGGVVAGGEDVRERQHRCQQVVVLGLRQPHECAVGLRHPHGLTLAAVDAGLAPVAAVQARGLQALLAELAGVVGVLERRDDEVALAHARDVRAGLLDDAEELVADRPALLLRRHAAVRPEVAAADARPDDADHGVGRRDQLRVGHRLHADVAGAVDESRSHEDPFRSSAFTLL